MSPLAHFFVLYSFLALIISLIVKWDALYTAILFLIPVQICSQQFSKIILADYYFFFQKTRFYFLFLELLSICVVCVFFPRSSVFLVALLTLKDLALIIIYLIKIRYSFKDFSIEIPFIKMLLKFGFVAMMTELLITFNYKLDLIMLKWYVDDVQLGLYSVGIALAEYIWIIPDAFKDVIYFKTSNSNAIKDILTSIRVNLLVSIVAMLGMVFLGYPFIYIMYGTDFLGSHIVTCVALLGVPAMIIYKLTNYLYLANGKQLFYFLSLCVSVFSNMLFNLLLIPYMGKIGAALASSLAYNICGLCFLIKFLRDYSIPWVEIVKFSKNDLFFLVGKIKK